MVFRLLLVAVISLIHIQWGFGQAKKPTLMVLPSDNWCVQRYFYSKIDNQGTTLKKNNKQGEI